MYTRHALHTSAEDLAVAQYLPTKAIALQIPLYSSRSRYEEVEKHHLCCQDRIAMGVEQSFLLWGFNLSPPYWPELHPLIRQNPQPKPTRTEKYENRVSLDWLSHCSGITSRPQIAGCKNKSDSLIYGFEKFTRNMFAHCINLSTAMCGQNASTRINRRCS